MRVTKYKVSAGAHVINLNNSVHRLLTKNRFIDVTLACDGQKIRCHRLILAAASPLFEELLMDNQTLHPTVIMPLGLKASTLMTLIDFMYTGEATVTKTGLTELLKSAEMLQVAGMFAASTDIREYSTEVEDDQVVDETGGFKKNFKTVQFKMHNIKKLSTQTDVGNAQAAESGKSTSTAGRAKKRQKVDVMEFIKIDKNVDVSADPLDEITIDEITLSPTNGNRENSSKNNLKDNDTAAALIANDEDTILQEANRIKLGKPNPYTILSTLPKVDVGQSVNLLQLTAATRSGVKRQTHSAKSQPPPKPIPWTYIHIPTVKTQVRPSLLKPSISRPILPKTTTPSPWTIYQPLPQLGPGQAYITSPIQITPKTAIKPAPITSFLKFNSSSMQISVNNLDRTDKQEKINVINMALETEPETISNPQVADASLPPPTPPPPPPPPPPTTPTAPPPAPPPTPTPTQMPPTPTPPPPPSQETTEIIVKTEPGDGEVTVGSTIVREADYPMFYAMIKKEQDDLALQDKEKEDDEIIAEAEAATAVAFEASAAASKAVVIKPTIGTAVTETEAEDIICQPTVSYFYDNDDDPKNDMDFVENEPGVCIDYDRLMAETYGIEVNDNNHQKKQTTTKRQPKKRQYKRKKPNDTTPSFLLPKSPSPGYNYPSTSMPLSEMSSSQALNNFFQSDEERLREAIGISSKAFSEEHRSTEGDDELHFPHSVILRSPRCNQPRLYSNDALFKALMAVKNGESIYRASRRFTIPRKTLRNWMKRWDIKSKFPMPKQLMDAAIRKKLNLLSAKM